MHLVFRIYSVFRTNATYGWIPRLIVLIWETVIHNIVNHCHSYIPCIMAYSRLNPLSADRECGRFKIGCIGQTNHSLGNKMQVC